ncbi:MAG: anti-sigma factor family protein [Pyrinomonadaceae bacterium]
MLNNNEHQNSSCAFAEASAAYLYGEIDDSEKLIFESHLSNCQTCVDELTDFSALRFSIAEWREADFESLPIPLIVLPIASRTNSGKLSWLETVRAHLNFSPIRMTAALAALLLCAGLFWFAANFSRDKNIAENKKTTIQKPIVPTNENVGDNKMLAANDNSETANEKSLSSAPVKIKNVAAKNNASSGRVSAPTNAASNSLNKSFAPEVGKNVRLKTPVKNDVPSLAVEEDEDGSPRLSDILDEVGMTNADEVNNE